MRIRPWSRGITAPSLTEVMRKESSGPSMRWPGASEDTIQLSTTEPIVEPMKPSMVAAETPCTAPPIAADGSARGAEDERGHGAPRG